MQHNFLNKKFIIIFFLIFFVRDVSAQVCDVNINSLPYSITRNNTYYCLTTSSTNLVGDAIRFGNSTVRTIQNSTLDCRGNNLDGDNIGTDSGVVLNSSASRNNTIKNCNITDFYTGILLNTSVGRHVVSGNSISYNTIGIELVSSNNTIINNRINNNKDSGVFQYCVACPIGNNTFINNTFDNNTYGVYSIVNVRNTIFINNTANYNSWDGFWSEDSNNYNHVFINNTANYNKNAGFELTFGNYNNTLIDNTANNNRYGFFIAGSYRNRLRNNTAINNTYGIYLAETYDNDITGGSVRRDLGDSDYYLEYLVSSTYFRNTNFTDSRKIGFYDKTSWFNYNNETAGNIWLKTNVSTFPVTITRKLVSWTQNLMKWNDTNSTGAGVTARYNITGLKASSTYNVYNNSALAYTLLTDPSGNLPSFTIFLSFEHEIKVVLPECVPEDVIICHTKYDGSYDPACLKSYWNHSTCGNTKVCYNDNMCKLVDADLTSYTLPSGDYARSDTLSIPYTVKNTGEIKWTFLDETEITKSDSTKEVISNWDTLDQGNSNSNGLSYAISCADPLGDWNGLLYIYTDQSVKGGWRVWPDSGSVSYNFKVVECMDDPDCAACKGAGWRCNANTCVPVAVCPNSICEAGETQNDCCADCGVPSSGCDPGDVKYWYTCPNPPGTIPTKNTLACSTGASDSDGQNFNTRGVCTDYTGCSAGECQSMSYTDICIDSFRLKEYIVSGPTCDFTEKNCADLGRQCIDGRCATKSQTVVPEFGLLGVIQIIILATVVFSWLNFKRMKTLNTFLSKSI